MSAGIRHVVMRLAMSDPDVERDAEDGRALRELREALGNDHHGMSIDVIPEGRYRDGRSRFRVTTWALLSSGKDPVKKFGATIAEAADACRKALEAAQ